MTDRFVWKVTIGGVDVSQFVVANGTIDHGRGSVFGGFSAPRAVFDLFTAEGWPAQAANLPTVDPADPVVITVTDLEHAVPYEHGRFTGKVQALEWSEYRLRVIAVGIVADWQHVLSGYPALEGGTPTEKDDARVARWAAQGEQTLIVEGGGGRWLRKVDYGATPEPLLDLLLSIAEDCDGLLMQDRFGNVRYRTRYRTQPARVTLPSAVIDKTTIDMVLEHGTLVNAVNVYYGNDPQDYVIQVDETYGSIDTYGYRETTLTTNLRLESGARGKGTTYIETNMNRWQVPDVTMVMALTDDTAYDLLISLQEGDPITLDDLPAGAPISSYDANVVGFTEVMSPTDYQMVLHLSQGLEPPDEDDGNWVEDGSITGGDETGTMVVDGRVYRWHKWTTTGPSNLTVTADVIADVLVVGGGGPAGSNFSYEGGGGGSGALWEGTIELSSTTGTYSVSAGAAGTGSSNGSHSKFADLWAYGGGRGGSAGGPGSWIPTDGGSGGGCGASSGSYNAGVPGQALGGSYDGGTTSTTSGFHCGDGGTVTYHLNEAGGGGAGGDGGSYNGAAGPGWDSDITGTTVSYAKGGSGGDGSGGGSTPGSGGSSGFNVINPGYAGMVFVRYPVTPGGGAGATYVYDEDIPYDTAITYEEA